MKNNINNVVNNQNIFSPGNSPIQGQINSTVSTLQFDPIPTSNTISEIIQQSISTNNDLTYFNEFNKDIEEANYENDMEMREKINEYFKEK